MCSPSSWYMFLAMISLCDAVSVVDSTYHPIQFSQGSPWPLPASITTAEDFQRIDAMLFHFNPTAHSCDILEAAFVRYFDIIFHGQPFYEKYNIDDISKAEKRRQQLLFKPKSMEDGLNSLDVAVQHECEKWPSLEMDESCELSVFVMILMKLTELCIVNLLLILLTAVYSELDFMFMFNLFFHITLNILFS